MHGLYLVTDRSLCGKNSLETVVLQAAKCGVFCVQLREKEMATRHFIEEAENIKRILLPYKIPLIINDRVDVALAVGASGVHLGQSDMPCARARSLMGSKAIIGLSVETWNDVEKSCQCDIDYIAASPVFATPTKTDTKGAWGLEGITKIRAAIRNPLVAIGGINERNAGAVVKAGADCLAVVSAICAAAEPAAAVRRLNEIIAAASARR